MPWSKSNLPDSVKNKGWTDAQIETFVKTANSVLESTGNEGEAIATGIKQADSHDEKKNGVSQKPTVFYAKHMQPGICKYDKEVVLVDTDALKKMAATGLGIPVYVFHQNVDYSSVKQKSCGWVIESFYNELDGWLWFKILVIDDEGRQAIARGWKVSNAYVPSEWGMGGKKNNCPYDREVVDAVFTHLAIVPDPRYEEACLMSVDEFKAYQECKRRELAELKNSLTDQPLKGFPMFKFLQAKKEEVTDASKLTPETIVEIRNDKGELEQNISLGELVNAVKGKKNSDDEDKEKKKKADEMENATVDIDGEVIPVKELINRYRKMNEKKNADEAEAKKKADEEKKNADEKAKKDKEEAEAEEKKNAHFFDEIRNAQATANAEIVKQANNNVVETSGDQLKRGQARYGSAQKSA
jgi:hypothetical protein